MPGEGAVPVPELLDELGRRGATNLLVEGGGRVLGAFLDAGEIDAFDVFIAPLITGGTRDVAAVGGVGVARMADSLRLVETEVSFVDRDVRVRGWVMRPWRAAPDSA
jgi:diaminohydroxyphosphoribosylaminopyrimidine deaminase/5-amino-6-(5-phosphoribosylamino)uracil reductase